MTTPGRVLFNEALPDGFRYVNELIGKNATPIGTIVEEISAQLRPQEVAEPASTRSSRWASASRPSRA